VNLSKRDDNKTNERDKGIANCRDIKNSGSSEELPLNH
jgi:hypothetical protein